jgi:transposase
LDLSFSLTILTDVSPFPTFPLLIDIRENSNDQWDFLTFIISSIRMGYLRAGDYLILDNASVHGGTESWPLLKEILDAAEVSIVFLPTYSPEFNPCELVFAFLKQELRINRNLEEDFIPELLRSLIKIDRAHIIKCYLHCLVTFYCLFTLIHALTLI